VVFLADSNEPSKWYWLTWMRASIARAVRESGMKKDLDA
jgi:hypothetical protein